MTRTTATPSSVLAFSEIDAVRTRREVVCVPLTEHALGVLDLKGLLSIRLCRLAAAVGIAQCAEWRTRRLG